jgi:DNA-binding NarL/FixJ family response regulator
MIDDPGTICKVIALGASYLIKTVRSEELVNAIRELHTTGKYTSECMKDALIAYKNLDVEDNLYGTDNELTQVERKVLLGICEEYSNAQIAGIIHRSERTVENIRRRISEKVGSKNVVGLIKYAYESGLYRPKSMKK